MKLKMVRNGFLGSLEHVLIALPGILDLFGYPEHPIFFEESVTLAQAEDTIYNAIAARKEGIIFTEVMKGFIHLGDEINDFDVAANQAKSECTDARFFLSVHAWDTNSRRHFCETRKTSNKY
jgi:hypothetical protein